MGGSGSASLVYKSLTRMAILSIPLSFRVSFGFFYLFFSLVEFLIQTIVTY